MDETDAAWENGSAVRTVRSDGTGRWGGWGSHSVEAGRETSPHRRILRALWDEDSRDMTFAAAMLLAEETHQGD